MRVRWTAGRADTDEVGARGCVHDGGCAETICEGEEMTNSGGDFGEVSGVGLKHGVRCCEEWGRGGVSSEEAYVGERSAGVIMT